MFLGAVLLFWIQPLFTKMALPLLGGSPSVWNTALVFFQAALLAGYAYAHGLARWFSVRGQVAVHALLLCAAGLALPIAVGPDWVPDAATPPVAWLMTLLAVSVGVPFLAVAATAPLLQRWFSLGPNPHAHDPYFLYAASNAGSVAVLLAFPFLLEPSFSTGTQSTAWTTGFAALAAGILVCGLSIAHRRPGPRPSPEPLPEPRPVIWRQRAVWMTYSATPSALLIGVSGHVSTDIASMPLLWVVPLALYLLSFVNAFSRKPWIPLWLAARAMAFGIVLLAATSLWREPVGIFLSLHLGTFLCVALACHGELARRRPHASRLTEFYLCLSAGGLVGGALVALAAPLAFDLVLEYPLALALAAALLPSRWPGSDGTHQADRWRLRRGDLFVAGGIAVMAFGMMPISRALGVDFPLVAYGTVLAVLAVVAFSRQVRPVAFGLCAASLLFAAAFLPLGDDTVWTGRSFFGVYRVTEGADPPVRSLMHGTTDHGGQWMPAGEAIKPTAYYTAASPAVEVLKRVRDLSATPLQVGVVGLGTGALAHWRELGERWRYYEIDPLVVWLATGSGHFGMLARHDPKAEIVVGDARLSLAREPDGCFDVLLLDVFTSDAIPTHLLTQEAVALYMRKLKPEGALLLHVSNRILDLEPVVAGAAAHLGYAAWSIQSDDLEEAANPAAAPSHWVVVFREEATGEMIGPVEGWARLSGDPQPRWRDDFSSLAGIVLWTGKRRGD